MIMGGGMLSCIDQPQRDCREHHTGEYWVIIEQNGQADSTLIQRSAETQIEVYKQKRDTSYVRWLNDCEFVLQMANPKNKQEEKALRFKILTTTDTTYTFEYSLVNSKNQALQGMAIKKTLIMFDILSSPDAWMALLTLTFLEIVLGIDNIIFISIAAGKLQKGQRRSATNIGLILAMAMRIVLLFGITWLTALKKPFMVLDQEWMHGAISWQAVILFAGGLFLLYKSTKEIHEKVEDRGHDEREVKKGRSTSWSKAIVQITVINIVFSFDSILTAIGMTNGISPDPNDALILMIIAVVISVLIMMLFANPVGDFVNRHPSIQVLGLSFLISDRIYADRRSGTPVSLSRF